MRAIIIATKGIDNAPLLSERMGASMLPLLDRPFIQHGVECLVEWGVTEVDFVLSHLPEKMEALLGDGERWGCKFHFHLARDPEHPYRSLAALFASPRSVPLVVGHGEALPLGGITDANEKHPLLLTHDEGKTPNQWTGWAVVPPGVSITLPDDASRETLHGVLMDEAPVERKTTCLFANDGVALLSATRALMGMDTLPFMHTAREVEKGIWLSRDVGLHPTVSIIPPVYIGSACRIGKKATIGPHAVLGMGCVVDEKTQIKNTAVFPWSYIGKDLSLADCLVDKNCLVNTAIGSEIIVTEAFIIGSLSEKEIRNRLIKLGSRTMGSLLLVLFAPLLLLTLAALSLTAKGRARSHANINAVLLPALSQETHWLTFPFKTWESSSPDCWQASWRHFLLVLLPGLIHVAKGDLRFVGLAPRTPESIQALPSDWRSIYLTGKGGLITEAMLNFGPSSTEDERYAAETFYTISAGFRYDLKLLLKYASQLLGITQKPK